MPLRLSVLSEPSMSRLMARVVEWLMTEHGIHGLLAEFIGTECRSQFEHSGGRAPMTPFTVILA